MADLSITPGNVQPDSDAITENVTVGLSAVVAGKAVYELLVSGEYRVGLAQANLIYKSELRGVMLTGGGSGQPGVMQTGGTIILGAAVVAVGTIYVVSPNAAGGIAPASDLSTGDYVTLVGIGVATNKIQLGILASGVLR